MNSLLFGQIASAALSAGHHLTAILAVDLATLYKAALVLDLEGPS